MAIRFKSAADAAALGASLRLARERRKMSRAKLEKRINVDRSQISRIERGQILLVSTNVQKICTYLRVQIEPYVGQSTDDRASLQSRLIRINSLLGGRQGGDGAVSQLLNALEAFAEAYSGK
ncbi:helix-turn-helix domain-containing protein [Dyella choica]|uniref:XRE family transcriptional regulator n=1 Tax=Dyella choica TaxID=1927959 RepID=A0A3S0R103_9GAMM|nr:XRE family transcriptional regulator [Dyella choica]